MGPTSRSHHASRWPVRPPSRTLPSDHFRDGHGRTLLLSGVGSPVHAGTMAFYLATTAGREPSLHQPLRRRVHSTIGRDQEMADNQMSGSDRDAVTSRCHYWGRDG